MITRSQDASLLKKHKKHHHLKNIFKNTIILWTSNYHAESLYRKRKQAPTKQFIAYYSYSGCQQYNPI